MLRSRNIDNFSKDSEGYVQMYTHGSCKTKNRSITTARVGVFFGTDSPLNISQPVSHKTTYKSAKIEACTRGLEAVFRAGERNVTINTDSMLVVNGMNKWIKKWKNNGWKTSVGKPLVYKIEFQELDDAVKKMGDVRFKKVPVRGNDGIKAARFLAANIIPTEILHSKNTNILQ